jgi:hypothetical protein
MDTLINTIAYLEGSIEKFTQLDYLVKSSKNIKEKTKHLETLYNIMEDTKGYIIDNNLCEIGLKSVNPKPFLDGLMKTTYFRKDIGGLIQNLKTQL